MARFCSQCGSPVKETALFCSICGHKLKSATQQMKNTIQQSLPMRNTIISDNNLSKHAGEASGTPGSTGSSLTKSTILGLTAGSVIQQRAMHDGLLAGIDKYKEVKQNGSESIDDDDDDGDGFFTSLFGDD